MTSQEKGIMLKLQSISENKLTNEIIIPLLESMRYLRVEFYGGPNEHGKDILCWEYDRFDELKLTVAQVKHFGFTSSASGKNSFQTVFNQLTQCFSENLPYNDGTAHLPNDALLISTYPIETKTLKSRLLGQPWSEKVTIIDGLKLVDLLVKHRPDLVKRIVGINLDIQISLESTLNNETLLKSLGYLERKSIKELYVGINFSLGRRTTELFFQCEFNPIIKVERIEPEDWEKFKENCSLLFEEFGSEFLVNSFGECEKRFKNEKTKFASNNRKSGESKKRRKSNPDDVEVPKYSININGVLLSKKVLDKRAWVEKTIYEFNENGTTVSQLTQFINRCKQIIAYAEILFARKNHFLPSLIGDGQIQIKDNYELMRLKISIQQVFDTGLNFTVLGEAGAGKTTCLQMYTINKKDDATKLHIYLPLSRVIQSDSDVKYKVKGKIKPDLLETEIENYLISIGVAVSKNQFKNILKGRKTTLLLDGVDEAVKKAPWLMNEINRFAADYEDIQIIVSCRTSGEYIEAIPFFSITLLPFTDEQKLQFVRAWFGESRKDVAKSIENHLRKNKGLSELVTNPLLTTILCVLAENKLPLPNTEIRLYSDRIDLLTGYYDNVKKISRTYTPPDILKTLAQKLAYTLHNNLKREEDLATLREYSIKLMSSRLTPEASLNALNELIDPCNILVPMNFGGRFGFGHLRFQEHLAAKELLGNRAINVVPFLTQGWWKGVLLYFSMMSDSLMWFIKMLAQEDQLTDKKKDILMNMINVRPTEEQENLKSYLGEILILDGWSDTNDYGF